MIPGIEGFILGIIIYLLLNMWAKLSPISLRRELAALIDALILTAVSQPILFIALRWHGPAGFITAPYFKQLGVVASEPSAYVSLMLMFATVVFLDAWFVWVIPMLLVANAVSPEPLMLPPAVIALAISSVINALYHINWEASKFQGTPGKLAADIQMVSRGGQRLSPFKSTARHFLKGSMLLLFLAPFPVQNMIPDYLAQPLLLSICALSLFPPLFCLTNGGRQCLYDIPSHVEAAQRAGEPKRLFIASLICFLVVADYLLGMSLAYHLLKPGA